MAEPYKKFLILNVIVKRFTYVSYFIAIKFIFLQLIMYFENTLKCEIGTQFTLRICKYFPKLPRKLVVLMPEKTIVSKKP